MEQGNNIFYIEQINNDFDKSKVRVTHVYTRVRVFVFTCSMREAV